MTPPKARRIGKHKIPNPYWLVELVGRDYTIEEMVHKTTRSDDAWRVAKIYETDDRYREIRIHEITAEVKTRSIKTKRNYD